jgi:hypothetical protein
VTSVIKEEGVDVGRWLLFAYIWDLIYSRTVYPSNQFQLAR